VQIDFEDSFFSISLTLEEDNVTLEGLVLNVLETFVKKNEQKQSCIVIKEKLHCYFYAW
jgi:hypothetical protein